MMITKTESAAAVKTYKLLGPVWARTFRCIWMLEELDFVPYELVHDAAPQSKLARKYNPTGKIPALLEYSTRSDDINPSFVLTESIAINTYLADVFRDEMSNKISSKNKVTSPLVPPAGTHERALYDSTVSFILSELDGQSLWMCQKHVKMRQHFGALEGIEEVARKQFSSMNQHLASKCSPYILGEHFTAADILYVDCLNWSQKFGWDSGWPDHLKDYHTLCTARPAYQKADKIRTDIMKASEENSKR